jgi:hypothetical protein
MIIDVVNQSPLADRRIAGNMSQNNDMNVGSFGTQYATRFNCLRYSDTLQYRPLSLILSRARPCLLQ